MTPFQTRRNALLAQMQAAGGGVAIIPTAAEVMRNSDADYPFRHDSYFFHLCGFMEPEAVLVLVAHQQSVQSILFCREKNVEREIWDGFRYGPTAAQAHFGVDTAFPIEALDQEMARLLGNQSRIFYSLGHHPAWDARVQHWLTAVRAQARSGISAPTQFADVRALHDELRLFKDDSEIASMRRAAEIASGAHARAMRMSRPGCHEYEIEAELLHEFRRLGAEGPAYTSIVATGANACVLHYRAGNAVLKDGDLVLIDAGCEYDSYASDITRTYPANGRFSGPQKDLYELALAAQSAALAAIGPGRCFTDSHDAAVRVLAQGMLDTGLLQRNKVGTLDDVISNGDFRQFYMHKTGHWLGLDVHDVGDYRENDAALVGAARASRMLRPGMVLTVEPGIYVRPAAEVPEQFWHIGIRIEDDVLVTANAAEVLSSAPKTVIEIEACMRHAA